MKVRGKSKTEMQKIFPKKLVHDDPDLISGFVNLLLLLPVIALNAYRQKRVLKS